MTDNTIKISVAIATHNGALYIEEQVQSMLSQTLMPFEIVVSDDGSTDQTRSILEKLSASSTVPIHIYSNQGKKGFTSNFMNAMRHCGGDYIALSDQDDVWVSIKLAELAKGLIATPTAQLIVSDAFITDASLIKSGKTLWQALGFTSSRQHTFSVGNQLAFMLRKNLSWGLTLCFPRHMVDNDQAEHLVDLWEFDGWLGIKASLSSNIQLCPKPLTCYRQHGNNVIGKPKLNYNPAFLISKPVDEQSYQVQLNRCEQLLEKKKKTRADISSGNLKALQTYISALKRRISLPNCRAIRWFFIFKHYLRGDYYAVAYSSPILSAIKDMLVLKLPSK